MSLQRRFLLCSLFSALVALLLFWPGRGGGFLLDDEATITDNPAVHVTQLDSGSLTGAAYAYHAGGGTRPLPMASFAVDYWRGGGNPAAFKTTNIAIHALTTLALAWFFRLLLLSVGWPANRVAWAAPALALAWAIHPMQVSSVLYIVQRMQTLGTLFLVLALWAYLKMRLAQRDDERSRQFGVLVVLFWVLALASKEDSVLLPAYTLALELTVLHFRAASPKLARALRQAYLLAASLGATAFLFVVLPRSWSSDAYQYRDFSSVERLLTQARVLAAYLGEIALPLPSRLPFYYDGLQPSRGLLQPASTLPCIILVLGLLALAWRLRRGRPLFALGVFLFFAGHFITSNALNLELAFEHRNHFPLIGAVLAVGDLMALAFAGPRFNRRAVATGTALVFIALACATFLRVQAWSTPLGFAHYSVQVAPHSERAWISLCRVNFERSNAEPANPGFREAVAACSRGAEIADGASSLVSLVVLKTIQGTARQADWQRLEERLQRVTMTPSNFGAAWYLVRYSNHDSRIDPRRVVRIIDLIGRRVGFRPDEWATFGYYALQKGLEADAYRYFVQAIDVSSPRSALPAELVADLRAEGRPDWAASLERQARLAGKRP